MYLPSPNLGGGVINEIISFYIDDILYKSPKGYTFSQWVNTSYNYNGWYNNSSGIINYNTNTHIANISINGVIEDGGNYKSSNGTVLLDFSTLSLGSTFNFGKYQVESEDPWDIEWEIIHKDSDGLIAQTKQIIDCRCFDAKESSNTNSDRANHGNNNWKYSNIKQFLNSDKANWYSAQHECDAPPTNDNIIDNNPYDTHKRFLYYFSDEEKNLLKDYTITLANNTVTDGSGSYTWTGKVWLPTYTQLGYGNNNNIAEGTKFDKYTDENSKIKIIHENCIKYNQWCIDTNKTEGTPWYYSLSSCEPSYSHLVYMSSYDGIQRNYAYGGSNGLAPYIYIESNSIIWY